MGSPGVLTPPAIPLAIQGFGVQNPPLQFFSTSFHLNHIQGSFQKKKGFILGCQQARPFSQFSNQGVWFPPRAFPQNLGYNPLKIFPPTGGAGFGPFPRVENRFRVSILRPPNFTPLFFSLPFSSQINPFFQILCWGCFKTLFVGGPLFFVVAPRGCFSPLPLFKKGGNKFSPRYFYYTFFWGKNKSAREIFSKFSPRGVGTNGFVSHKNFCGQEGVVAPRCCY